LLIYSQFTPFRLAQAVPGTGEGHASFPEGWVCAVAGRKLLKRARGLKVAIVTGLDPDRRAVYKKLSKLRGADFDKEYMKTVVSDHEKAVKLFTSYSKSGKDEELRTFAKDTLPTLKKHLKQAREINDKLKD
jgi:predicted outer membrane protein